MESVEKLIVNCNIYVLNKSCLEGNDWSIDDIILRDEQDRPCFKVINVGCIKTLSSYYFCYNCAITLRKCKSRIERLRLHNHISY